MTSACTLRHFPTCRPRWQFTSRVGGPPGTTSIWGRSKTSTPTIRWSRWRHSRRLTTRSATCWYFSSCIRCLTGRSGRLMAPICSNRCPGTKLIFRWSRAVFYSRFPHPYSLLLRFSNHHFGCLDEGDPGFAGFQLEFPHGVGGDDGGDALFPNGKHHFGQQALDGDLDNYPEKLVAAADARAPGVRDTVRQEFLQRADRNAMVASRCFDGLDASCQDPVLEGRVADAEPFRGLAGR